MDELKARFYQLTPAELATLWSPIIWRKGKTPNQQSSHQKPL